MQTQPRGSTSDQVIIRFEFPFAIDGAVSLFTSPAKEVEIVGVKWACNATEPPFSDARTTLQ